MAVENAVLQHGGMCMSNELKTNTATLGYGVTRPAEHYKIDHFRADDFDAIRVDIW